MSKPKVAVLSFPGNNCEVESVRVLRENGMDAMFFRWNDDRSLLKDCDGYFVPGGFSYEDRGRSGMVAARDPLLDFLKSEAEAGKTIIGNCNGAQILVESGLIPLGDGLQMSLAHNAVKTSDGFKATGFLNEWVWITPSVARDRCATSDWEGTMHIPMAHGEGRFTTRDADLFDELKTNNQIAFSYCDQDGNISTDVGITPNGSEYAIAGICNPAGNVVALMPHPERTAAGAPYFQSLSRWLQRKHDVMKSSSKVVEIPAIQTRTPRPLEIFIDTIITNNEERTVEQAARRSAPFIRIKQWKYLSPDGAEIKNILHDLTIFNANKQRAFIRRNGEFYRWNHDAKSEEKVSESILKGVALLRRDIPDTGAIGKKGESGICYCCTDVSEKDVTGSLLTVFFNPHASVLERILYT